METKNINDYVRDTGLGSGINKLKIDDNGSVLLRNGATAWSDIATSLIGRRLYSATGSIDYDYAESALSFSANGDISDVNDVINFNLQMPHTAKLDSSLNLHIHWEQTDGTPREFTVHHRIQSNGHVKNETWVETVVDTSASLFDYTSGTMNQITDLVSIDLSEAHLSAVIQFKLTRSDAVAGNIISTFVDAHYEIDGFGSNEEYEK